MGLSEGLHVEEGGVAVLPSRPRVALLRGWIPKFLGWIIKVVVGLAYVGTKISIVTKGGGPGLYTFWKPSQGGFPVVLGSKPWGKDASGQSGSGNGADGCIGKGVVEGKPLCCYPVYVRGVPVLCTVQL